MSIVIAVMIPDRGVHLYADKRSVTTYGNKTIVSNNFPKIGYVTSNIAYGITGDAWWGKLLSEKVKNLKTDKASDLIEYVLNSSPQKKEDGSTFTLAGIYDDGDPFLWGYKTNGEATLAREEGYLIAGCASNQECYDLLFDELDLHEDINKACEEVICLASEQFPELISKDYARIEIRA